MFAVTATMAIANPLSSDNIKLNVGASQSINKPETNITGVSLGPVKNLSSQFIVNLDGPVTYNIFILTEPDRIVIELENTIGSEKIESHDLKNDMVLLIRSGTTGDNKSRIIIDLKFASYVNSKLIGLEDAGQYQLVIETHQIPQLKPEQDKPAVTADRPVSNNTEIIQLSLNYQNAPLGSIDALDYDAGYMLPLSQLFQVLGFPINVHYDSGIAEGWFVRSTQNFILDIPKRQIIVKGKKSNFLPNLVQQREQDIFVDISLLGKYLPVLFHIDPSSLSLTINPNLSLSKNEQEAMTKQWLTPGRKATIDAAQPSLPLVSLKEPLIDPLKKDPDQITEIYSDDNLIILQPVIDDEPLDEFMEVYHVQDRFMVPLGILSDILDFNISVSAETGQAKGWFINDKRSFLLDINNKHAKKLDGSLTNFISIQVFATDNEFYIDTVLLSQLLPLDLEVVLNELTLEIIPREALPFQIRKKRLKTWERIQSRRRTEKNYNVIDIPYEMTSVPFVDLRLTHTNTKNLLERDSATFYSLLASGDTGYLNSTLFASGGDVDSLSSFRFNAGRRSVVPDLLGPMKATQFFVGDINSVTVPLIAQSTLGRGFKVSNRDIYRSSQFDSTNFIDNALPDWEIELYHNGTLIDFQVVGDNGRYAFLDVPILFGNNTFRLISHGPQGQIREEIKRFNIGSSFLRRGESNYEFSIDEKSKLLIEADEGFMIGHPNKIRYAGELEYGLTNMLVGTLGLVSTPLQDGEHRYLSSGLRTGSGTVLADVDLAYDQSNHGWATKLSLFTGIHNLGIKAEHKKFDNFVSEAVSDVNSLLTSQTELGINSTFSLPFFTNINFNLSNLREEFEIGGGRTVTKNRISKSFYGVRFTNKLEKTSFGGNQITTGEFALRGRLYTTLLRGKLNYRIKPESEKERLELSVQNKIFRNTLVLLRWSKLYGASSNTDNTSTFASLSWDHRLYKYNVTANVTDNDNYNIGVNLIFSLGRNSATKSWHMQGKPMAFAGAVTPKAFLDTNFNSIFDAEDELIERAVFIVNNKRESSENESPFITGLQINRFSSIELDPTSLDDSLWIPAIEGARFLPRPGVAPVINFPVISASEIDGTVYALGKNNHKKTLSRIKVQLVDIKNGDVVQTFKSEFDGYYLFEKVHPGNYIVRISRFDLSFLDLEQVDDIKLEVKSQSDVYSGNDIILHKTLENALQ